MAKVASIKTKDPKKAKKSIEAAGGELLPLLHKELHQEIISLCRSVADKSKEVFLIANECHKEGKINIQDAASLANLLNPIVELGRIIKESNIKEYHDNLEAVLVKNGLEKTNVN